MAFEDLPVDAMVLAAWLSSDQEEPCQFHELEPQLRELDEDGADEGADGPRPLPFCAPLVFYTSARSCATIASKSL